MEELDVFNVLNKVNVSQYVEKKNGLSYLAWANAWAEIKKRYPLANYTIYENSLPNGYLINYFTDGKTAWVKTGVTINGLEHIEELPVMDFRNKSIPIEAITSFDVNKAIQRSLTKAVARHGLGLYIYAGEDLPEELTEECPTINATMEQALRDMIKELRIQDETVLALLAGYNCKKLNELQVKDLISFKDNLKKIGE